jgi:hypothetical protein
MVPCSNAGRVECSTRSPPGGKKTVWLWYLSCGWCRNQVAYAVYGKVFQRGTRFLVDAEGDEA